MYLHIVRTESETIIRPERFYLPTVPLRVAVYELNARGVDCKLHRPSQRRSMEKPVRAPIILIDPFNDQDKPPMGRLRIANGDWQCQYTIDAYHFRISLDRGLYPKPLTQEIRFCVYKPNANPDAPDIKFGLVSRALLGKINAYNYGTLFPPIPL